MGRRHDDGSIHLPDLISRSRLAKKACGKGAHVALVGRQFERLTRPHGTGVIRGTRLP